MTPGCVTHTTDRSFFVWNHTGSTGIVITGQFGGAITVLGTVSTAAGMGIICAIYYLFMGTMGAGKHKDSTDSGTLSESVLMCIVHFH